jgi:hypothetical protein
MEFGYGVLVIAELRKEYDGFGKDTDCFGAESSKWHLDLKFPGGLGNMSTWTLRYDMVCQLHFYMVLHNNESKSYKVQNLRPRQITIQVAKALLYKNP